MKNPEAEYCFMVDTNATNMDADKSDVFHTTIAKSLFIFKRVIPNIQPKVPFLCNRVKEPEKITGRGC